NVRRGLVASLVGALLVACGARTTLFTPDIGTAVDDEEDTGTHPTKDAAIDVRDAARDAIVGPACSTDAECNDSISCTRDRCDHSLGRCVFEPDDTRCDDGVFCNGDEICDPSTGCVRSSRACDDGIACTH